MFWGFWMNSPFIKCRVRNKCGLNLENLSDSKKIFGNISTKDFFN